METRVLGSLDFELMAHARAAHPSCILGAG